jgi:hypothetical protein
MYAYRYLMFGFGAIFSSLSLSLGALCPLDNVKQVSDSLPSV